MSELNMERGEGLDLSVLEESVKAKEGEFEEEEPVDEEQLFEDLADGIVLIRRVTNLLNFIVDPELCKVLSKRERVPMHKLIEKMSEYVDAIEANYGEIGSLVP